MDTACPAQHTWPGEAGGESQDSLIHGGSVQEGPRLDPALLQQLHLLLPWGQPLARLLRWDKGKWL